MAGSDETETCEGEEARGCREGAGSYSVGSHQGSIRDEGMTIEIQRRGGRIFIHYKKEDIIVTLSLDMFEARILYDFFKDMVQHEGDSTVINAIVEDTARDILDKTGRIPSAAEIVVTASQNRRNKIDRATRNFLLGDKK